MFGHHHRGPRGLHGMRGRREWGPFSIEWEMGEGRGRGRGHGRGRVFSGDELQLVLLKLIEDTPRHGYDLIRAIEERTNGAYVPSAGVVYPTLTLLADMDYIVEQASEGARKQFSISQAGIDHLAEKADEVAALMARLDTLGEMRARGNRGPLRRAVMNLKAAIASRVDDDRDNEDLPHEIAAILDEAARKIERL